MDVVADSFEALENCANILDNIPLKIIKDVDHRAKFDQLTKLITERIAYLVAE
jgi:hypothetical protein